MNTKSVTVDRPIWLALQQPKPAEPTVAYRYRIAVAVHSLGIYRARRDRAQDPDDRAHWNHMIDLARQTVSALQAQADKARNESPLSVNIDGPEPVQDRDGDEVPSWTVCVIDADGDPVGTVYRLTNHGAAVALAARMADDRNLNLQDDSTPA